MIMASRFMALILTVVLCAFHAQGRAEDPTASKNKHTVYAVKFGDAKALASILEDKFKDETDIGILADTPSNCLLISAAPKVFDEIVKALEKVDRRPPTFAIEVLIVDVAPIKGEDGKLTAKELDLKEFTGSTKEVLEKVEGLQKKGLIEGLKRLQLTVVENLPTKVYLGELKPYAIKQSSRREGEVSTMIRREVLGIQAEVSARFAPDNAITVEVDVSQHRMRFPEDGVELFKDQNGASVRAPELVKATLKTKVTMASEKAAAVQGVKTESKSGQAQTLVIVTARILEPGGKGSK